MSRETSNIESPAFLNLVCGATPWTWQLFLIWLLSTLCPVMSQAAPTSTNFTVTIEPPEHGKISVEPAVPADGKVPAGTVLTLRISPDRGYAIDSGYCTGPAPWTPAFYEFFTPEFQVTVDQDRKIGASFIKKKALKGFTVTRDVVYAQPGVKKLVYDVYSPERARELPCIIIIHGGGFIFNTQGIMRGLARELVRDGKYVVFSIDYRWFGTRDGDSISNTLPEIVEDTFGAIAHIQEHAKEYGGDPARIAVTGDSAGGYLAAVAIDMVNQIGDGGFGAKAGVYEFKPTYLPRGKSTAQVREEMREAIKAAAPSYGVFSTERLAVTDAGTNQPVVLLKELAPRNYIPNIRDRAVPQLLLRGKLDPTIADAEVQHYADALKAAGQRVEYIQVKGAGHAFFDWKPDAETKATFAKYGVPNTRRMEKFFNAVFYSR